MGWFRHVQRMDEEIASRKIYEARTGKKKQRHTKKIRVRKDQTRIRKHVGTRKILKAEISGGDMENNTNNK